MCAQFSVELAEYELIFTAPSLAFHSGDIRVDSNL